MSKMDQCPLVAATSFADERFDCVVVVTDSVDKLTGSLAKLKPVIAGYIAVDSKGGSTPSLIVTGEVPSRRLVYSPTGPLDRDQDDVRSIADAAEAGIKRALGAGSKKPLLVRPVDTVFADADLCALLGALHAVYVPLEIREIDANSTRPKVSGIGWWCEQNCAKLLQIAAGLEAGRYVARDLGGSDPERMAPPRVMEYVQTVFAKSSVSVQVMEGHDIFEKEYPLMAAVNRAARFVDRHQGRVIWLEYTGSGKISETVMVVGKGICYDTGGADIKAGGVMAGMHRDKCGASAVAGFFKMLDVLKPAGLRVVGAMSMVRNSVGSECYVADEIITSRAGCRVRVGNTDAEGGMAIADILCHMKEKALKAVNPRLFTWGSVSGQVAHAARSAQAAQAAHVAHVAQFAHVAPGAQGAPGAHGAHGAHGAYFAHVAHFAHGNGYSAVMGNGPAVQAGIPEHLIKSGGELAEPCALSTITREDYAFAAGKSEYEDVLQCNNAPSSRTPRGHQFPAAFMILAAGLEKHGKNSAKPLAYTHVDVAGSSGPFPGLPTGAPIIAFAKNYVLNKL